MRASAINMEMKIAAAHALAELAREDVPDEVAAALRRAAEIRARLHHSGAVRSAADLHVPPAVAKAAMDTGVARKPIVDMDGYRQQLNARRDPIAGTLVQVYRAAAPKSRSASCSPKARKSR